MQQSGSQNRSPRYSGIDFENVGLCTVDHCANLAIVEERFGPGCGGLMYTLGRKLASYTEMPYTVESFRDVCSDYVGLTMSFERLAHLVCDKTKKVVYKLQVAVLVQLLSNLKASSSTHIPRMLL